MTSKKENRDHLDKFNHEDFNDPRPKALGENMMRLFRKLDLYALPVTLRYKGEKKFYTNFGACTSLIIILLMVYTTTTMVIAMYAIGPNQITVSANSKLVSTKCDPLTDSSCIEKL